MAGPNDLPADFDAAAYLELHRDVAAAGADAATHYREYGRLEGRAYRRADLCSLRAAFLERMRELEHFVWLLNRMPSFVPPAIDRSPALASHNDLPLVQRVMTAYRDAARAFAPSGGFWDQWHAGLKKPIHDALAGNDVDAAAAVLRNPASSVFFWGFDAIASSPHGEPEPHELVLKRLSQQKDWQELYALWLCDALVSLAEIVGARRMDYPEIELDATLAGRGRTFDVDAALNEIEREWASRCASPIHSPTSWGSPPSAASSVSEPSRLSIRACASPGW